jgi:flagellar biogenesis protein FliO
LPRSDGTLRLRGRLALDARRCIYLVEVGGRVLVLGAGEGGISKLAEMPGDALPEQAEAPRVSFADVLAKVGVGSTRSNVAEPPPVPAASSEKEPS